jgi:hypothetical protein
MKPPSHRLDHGLQQEAAETQGTHTTRGQEFVSPEEMLRHDRSKTPIPAAILNRLGAAMTGDLPRKAAKAKPWWKRLL